MVELQPDRAVIEQVLANLTELRKEMAREEAPDSVAESYRASAANLLHYLALRRHDLRPLQEQLAELGLSSLGRAESHVMATMDAVIGVLRRLLGQDPLAATKPVVDFKTGRSLLAANAEKLLGPTRPSRSVRIMVTMPSEAAHDYDLISELLRSGMDCMRINCAHDDPATWERMISHLRRAEEAHDRSCQIVMDLGGPKLRTGPVLPGPQVVKVRPHRDSNGRVTAPARLWLTSDVAATPAPSAADAALPVPKEWLEHLELRDVIAFVDARGSKRTIRVVDLTQNGAWAEATKTAYCATGTVLKCRDLDDAKVGSLKPTENAIHLAAGDRLILTRDLRPGREATFDGAGRLLTPASIGCTIPAVFDDVQTGESIWFDDGLIGGVIEHVTHSQLEIRVTQTRVGGGKLRADKGINLPESDLKLGALTLKDLRDLDFVANHADVVELSFANRASDVSELQQRLTQLGDRRPAIVLKIETQRAFLNLPAMLLTAMQWPRCGVMIARGDLAVECGFVRLAEVQEEILWISEAAHVPVIWATQVLETLAKEGMPSRAEITDAAMGHRAECVMLNKGPHMVVAVKVLDDILHRMQAHQTKKRAMLRELHLAHAMVQSDSPSQEDQDHSQDPLRQS